MTVEYTGSSGAYQSRAYEAHGLSLAELDVVIGGADPNYHECVLGTTAGGGPGLYPLYVQCREK